MASHGWARIVLVESVQCCRWLPLRWVAGCHAECTTHQLPANCRWSDSDCQRSPVPGSTKVLSTVQWMQWMQWTHPQPQGGPPSEPAKPPRPPPAWNPVAGLAGLAGLTGLAAQRASRCCTAASWLLTATVALAAPASPFQSVPVPKGPGSPIRSHPLCPQPSYLLLHLIYLYLQSAHRP